MLSAVRSRSLIPIIARPESVQDSIKKTIYVHQKICRGLVLCITGYLCFYFGCVMLAPAAAVAFVMLAPAAAVAFVMLAPAAAVAFVMLAACAFTSWAGYTATVTKVNIIAADMMNDISLFIHKLVFMYRDKYSSPIESP
jgi:hypothetical protein